MGLIDAIRRWREGKVPSTLGGRGEFAAAVHLRQLGYRIIARNLETGAGEIDILADDRATGMLVIVEVKAARSENPPPEVHVNAAKQRKLSQVAGQLLRRRRFADRAVRFDVVGVVWPDEADAPTRVTHHPGAFESRW